MPSERTHFPRLPACHSCYHRKVKCDSKRPRCSPCAKNGHECMVLSLDDDGTVTRQQIYELEERERMLTIETAALGSGGQGNAVDHPTGQSHTETEGTTKNAERSASFVDGGGLGFMTSLFMDPEWRENNADLLQTLAKASQAAESTVQPNPFPSSGEARFLFDKYLEATQIQVPFLLRGEIELLYARVYTNISGMQVASHDLFRVFMISAIGSVLPHRNGSYDAHPFGHFLAAMQHFDQNFLAGGIHTIQDLQLIGRFGIYHHIGTSIWDITQLCIRMCIEHGFHLKPTTKTTLIEEHIRRRLFWECYMIDRYSSTMLDRPCAIAEADIQVGFPADANDDEIIEANDRFPDLDSFTTAHTPQGNTEMTVFNLCLRLRQITSLIHSKFTHTSASSSSPSKLQQNLLATGKIYSDLDELLGQLQRWRNLAPVFDNPRCLYETQEWYDHLLARERLLLIRKAVDLVPKRNGVPPKDLLVLCLEAGIRNITLFSKLFLEKRITYTRSYFQMMFTAGLSVMFCISATTDLEPLAVQEAISALAPCEKTLRLMGIHLPDAQHYATAFEALRRNVTRKWDRLSRANSHPNIAGEPSVTNIQGPNSGLSFSQFPIDPNLERHQFSDQQTTLGTHSVQPNPNLLDFQTMDPNPDWTSSMQSNGNVPGMNYGWGFDDDVLHWAFLNDNTLWNMEAGLGEYAYGDQNPNLSIFDGLGLNL